MPKLPRDLSQDEVVRALVRLGGTANWKRGKGSHCIVYMASVSNTVIVPTKLRTGTLNNIIKGAGLTIDEFVEAL